MDTQIQALLDTVLQAATGEAAAAALINGLPGVVAAAVSNALAAVGAGHAAIDTGAAWAAARIRDAVVSAAARPADVSGTSSTGDSSID